MRGSDAEATADGRPLGHACLMAVIQGVREPGAAAETPGRTATLLTAAQLADRWQVPVRTIYAWARRNAIPHYRAGRLFRFDPAEVEDHFRNHGFAAEVVADAERPGESAFTLAERLTVATPACQLRWPSKARRLLTVAVSERSRPSRPSVGSGANPCRRRRNRLREHGRFEPRPNFRIRG